ncbi:MAG: oligosaccharide flippase family protein [Lachnospiraceae bacterium]|nr:oligosaccharide flippase family protein [Lachnospiraceae bacterium]
MKIKKISNMPLPLKASFWFVVCSVIQKCITFITTPIFTRLLSTEDFGLISLFSSWQSILTVFFTLDLFGGVYNKAMIVYEDDKDGYTSSTLFLTTIICGVFFGIYLPFHNVINGLLGLGTPFIILMFLNITGNCGILFWTGRCRFDYRYKSIVILTLSSLVLSTAVSILLVLSVDENKALYRVIGMVIPPMAINLWCYIQLLRKGKKLINIAYWKYAVSYNLPLIPHYLSMQILNQSDRIMINTYCGSAYAGIYSVAYQLSFALNMFTNAIHASYAPWSYRKLKEGDFPEIKTITNAVLVSLLAGCLVLSLFAPELIYILGGVNYAEAIWIVPPVAMSVFFNMSYNLIGVVAMYHEKTRFIMVGSLLAAGSNLILNRIFIPRFGFVAAGYTTMACYLIYFVAHYCYLCIICRKTQIEIPFDKRLLFFASVLALGATVVCSVLYLNMGIRYITIVILMAICGYALYKNRQLLNKIITLNKN